MKNLRILVAIVVLVLIGRSGRASASTLTTLHGFTGGTDGAQPLAGLVEGSDSNFYGTTSGGGTFAAGTVFRVSPTGALITLHSFANGTDGANPKAGLIEGSDSNFYGTTFSGGMSGSGTVFKISSAGKLTPLWSFTGGVDGGQPSAGLVEGSDGNFYGTTFSGGMSGSGTVFKISSAGTLTTLHSFGYGTDGANPKAGLIEGGNGEFYGTTAGGGASGTGTVFKISSAGTLTTLWNFTGGVDGANPQAGLIEGSVSNFYGTTAGGGSGNAGTVFTLVQPCTYSLSPTYVTVPAIALSNTFTVTASSTNCPWTATNNVDWITITSASSGEGDGTVAYSVAANTNATVSSRVGTITVAGKAFTVTQQPLVFGQFLQGTYDGLVIQTNAPSQASSGFISLVLNKTGSFAANLTVGGVRSSFKGQFDMSGNATTNVPRAKLSPLQVTLHLLDVTNGTDQVTGTVSDGVFTSELLADLAVFSSVNPSPFAGRYTFVLAPADSSDPTVPQGYGYGTLTVTTTGSGHMQGVLGDGTTISETVPISWYGTWPLYDSLYKNRGSCIGWVTVDTNNTLGATMDWFKLPVATDLFYRGGFTTTVALTGATYLSPTAGVPSVAGTNTVTLGGGNLTSDIVKSVGIDAHGKVTVFSPGSDKLTLNITPATGQFSGSFLNPAIAEKTFKFNGLLLQTDNSGAGFFLGTNQSGFVTVEPVP
jgi:uncharacterized repeat protein (TIGR03803 family)